MDYLFYNCNLPEEVDLSGFRMDEVTSTANMFAQNPNVKYINVDGVYAPKLGWNFLTGILTTNTERLDFSKNETPMTYSYTYSSAGGSTNAYGNYPNLKELLIPNATLALGLGPTGKIFNESPLEKISVGTLDPKYYNATYPQYTWPISNLCSGRQYLKEAEIKQVNFINNYVNFANLFYNCPKLERFNLNNMDTSLNTSLNSMFKNCSVIESIDLSWMETKLVTTMYHMFAYCYQLKELNITGFDFSETTTINGMLAYTGFETYHIKDINYAPKLTDISYLFRGCENLTEITAEETTDFDLATSLAYWCESCKNLVTMNLKGVSLPKVTNFTYMFQNCLNLEEIDLSGVTTASNVQAQYMFQNCAKLKKLDIRNWQINKITTSSYYVEMFTNVPNDCQIIVKDANCRSWIKSRKSTFTNVVLPSEIEE